MLGDVYLYFLLAFDDYGMKKLCWKPMVSLGDKEGTHRGAMLTCGHVSTGCVSFCAAQSSNNNQINWGSGGVVTT